MRDAACVAVAYGTVEHMLFDNAQLEPGETVLVHAGGSGIGSIAIRIAKSIGCTVITTVGSADKAEKAKALGADHVINYREDRFEGVVRKLTKKKGVDVVFEHTGADTWAGSLLSMKRGGRLVTCGATSGPIGSLNLMQLFQQQYRITGSFGAPMSALARALDRIASGVQAGDRHGLRPGRFPSRRGPAGNTGRVRQDPGRTLTRVRRQLALYGDRILGRLVKWLIRLLRRTDPDRASDFCGAVARRIGPLSAGAPDRPGQSARRVPRQGRGLDRGDTAGSLGQPWPRRRRVRAHGAHLGLRSRPSQRAAASRPTACRCSTLLRTDGKPALCFAAHLANWELPAIAAAAHGLPSAVVYRMPNNKAVAKEIIRIRAPLMGRLIRTRAQAAWRWRRR